MGRRGAVRSCEVADDRACIECASRTALLRAPSGRRCLWRTKRGRPRRRAQESDRTGDLLVELARWCSNHRRIVIVGWIVIAIATTVAAQAVGRSYSTNFRLPGTQSQRALDLLEHDFADAERRHRHVRLPRHARDGRLARGARGDRAAAREGGEAARTSSASSARTRRAARSRSRATAGPRSRRSSTTSAANLLPTRHGQAADRARQDRARARACRSPPAAPSSRTRRGSASARRRRSACSRRSSSC